MSGAVDETTVVHRIRAPLARALLRLLCAGMHQGHLRIVLPDGTILDHRGARSGSGGLLVMHRWRVLYRLLLGGDVAFGEAYIDGDWSSPDIVGLLTLAAANDAGLAEAVSGTLPTRLLNRLRHALRSNTLRGSRRNIVEHYDLGNPFYALWLDGGMSYSSALYRAPHVTLEEAQAAKLERVIELLRLDGGDCVLEIGCGWGGLAIRLAQGGARVTALTLSPAQRDYAVAAIEAAGLSTQIELRLEDYRQVSGRYDRIVSIEMLEAVGEAYWPMYFERLRSLLKPGGTAVLQVITIADDRFGQYRRRPDFIQRHVFPGGMLPCPSVLRAQIARAALAVEKIETFGDSYARTLQEWRARFLAAHFEVAALGLSTRFRRLWDYYLAYCETGFRTGVIDVGLWQLRA